MRRLHNDDWGFESNCFVCEQRNDAGLRIPFFHDPDREVVVADFDLGESFSGAPTLVHGGVTLAVLDEAQAWAAIALAGRFAVTVETTTRFAAPVNTGRQHRVEARVVEVHGDDIRTTAVVTDPDGRTCATSEASFLAVGPAQARSLLREEDPDLDPVSHLLADDGP